MQKAVSNMNQYGYCIIPKLLNVTECKEYGEAVLQDVQSVSTILFNRDNIDIYNPQYENNEPQNYRELSMREDLRFDLRHGPKLDKIRRRSTKEKEEESCSGSTSVNREGKGKKSIVLTSSEKECSSVFLRGNGSLLEIIRRTMNPRCTRTNSDHNLWVGNIGRWNFGGCGPNGSFQNIRLSPVYDNSFVYNLPNAFYKRTSYKYYNRSRLFLHKIHIDNFVHFPLTFYLNQCIYVCSR